MYVPPREPVLPTFSSLRLSREHHPYLPQVGPNWLNPTERAVWPLEETLQVAELAFQGLETSAETQAYGKVTSSCGWMLWGTYV